MNMIGKKVRELRKEKGLTQSELTAKCNLVGFDISRSTLAKIEAQVRQVLDTEVSYLAKALDIKEGELF